MTRHFQQRVIKYNFKQVQDLLLNNHCKITFRSLTSNKIHAGIYHIPKKIQSSGDKILVSNFHTGEYEDIDPTVSLRERDSDNSSIIVDDPNISELKNEIQSIRGLLEEQVIINEGEK